MIEVRRQLAVFSPADLERISGLTMVMQRDWRRRGYLADYKGKHASFSAFELVEVAVMKAMADRGYGPATARSIAKVCPPSIVWYIISAQKFKILGDKVDLQAYKKFFDMDEPAEISRIANVSFLDVYRYICGGKNVVKLSNDIAQALEEAADDFLLVSDLERMANNISKRAKQPFAIVTVGRRAAEL